MTQKSLTMHGRDHRHGGSDPRLIAWEDVAVTPPVGSALFFAYDFQDSDADLQFTDTSGNGRQLGLPNLANRPIRSSDTALPGKTYSMKTVNSDQCFASVSTSLAGYADGFTKFWIEWWYRPIANVRGLFIGNEVAGSGLSTFWGVGVDATGHVYVKRFGNINTSTYTPAVGAFVHYVVQGDGSLVHVFADNIEIATVADAAGIGNAGGGLIFSREQTGSSTFVGLNGYFGAVNAYTVP